MKYTFPVLFFLIIGISGNVFGLSPTDSILKLPKTKYQSEEAFDRQSAVFTVPDSSLDNIQRYRNRYNLGNSGLAVTNLYFPSAQSALGFNYAPNNFESYLFRPQNIQYFNTRTPYTELFFLVGAKNELYSNFIHSQNVTKNLNFTAKFQRIRSDGFYNRQNTNHTDFSISSNYVSPDKRYLLLSSGIINSLNNAENGGITSDPDFENGPLQDRKLLSTNLADANRRYNSKSFYLKQYLNLGPKRKSADTSVHLQVLPTSVFAHSFLIQQEHIVYSDPSPQSGFYKENYIDTTRTLDSTTVFKIENEFSWRLLNKKNDGSMRNMGFEAGIKQQYVNVSQFAAADTILKQLTYVPNPASLIPLPIPELVNGPLTRLNNRKLLSSSFNNFMLNAEVYNYDTKKAAYGLRADYVLAGYNARDYNLNALLRYNLGEDSLQYIGITGNASERRPDYMYLHYYSNNFIWNNTFSPVSSLNLKIYYRWTRYKLEVGVVSYYYKNYVYFNEAGAAQSTSAIQGYSAYLDKSFYVKHFVFKNKITYQHVPDSSVIRLPTWVTEQSLYYDNSLFKKALKFQVGVDVFYNSAYYASAYSPELGQFYLQNNKQIGNYPYVDVFLNLKISRARIFFKYENVNAYLGNFTYYYAPHYPWTDAAFKFGASWKFFD